MEIQKLSAVFNRQETPPFTFAPGLNVLKLPSQEAASLWSAFLRDMLYGPAPGQPPGSAASQGRLEAATPWGSVTITRWTASEDAPLAAFSAAYTGGGPPAAYLTASNCGGLLLGISREVYDQHATLRAAAPSADPLGEYQALPGILEEDQPEYGLLQARALQLEDLLSRYENAGRREAALAAENAHLDFVSARDKVKTMEAARKPPPSKAELTAIRTALDNLEAQDIPVRQAKQRMEQAERALEFAQSSLDAYPLAQPPLEEPEPRPKPSLPIICIPPLAGLALGGAAACFSGNWLAAASGGLGLFGLLALLLSLPLLRRQKEWDGRRAEADARRTKEENALAILRDNAEKARAARREAVSAHDAARAARQANQEQILNLVRSFRPFVKDVEEARQAVADGLLMRRDLDRALREQEDARTRWEELKEHAVYPLPPPVQRPAGDPEPLRQELAGVTARLDALHARYAEALEERAARLLFHLEGAPGDQQLAAQLAFCALSLPPSAPILLDCALDRLDGGGLAAALDCLVELSQSRQVILLTALDREVSCLRRTHPDRFHLIQSNVR